MAMSHFEFGGRSFRVKSAVCLNMNGLFIRQQTDRLSFRRVPERLAPIFIFLITLPFPKKLFSKTTLPNSPLSLPYNLFKIADPFKRCPEAEREIQ